MGQYVKYTDKLNDFLQSSYQRHHRTVFGGDQPSTASPSYSENNFADDIDLKELARRVAEIFYGGMFTVRIATKTEPKPPEDDTNNDVSEGGETDSGNNDNSTGEDNNSTSISSDDTGDEGTGDEGTGNEGTNDEGTGNEEETITRYYIAVTDGQDADPFLAKDNIAGIASFNGERTEIYGNLVEINHENAPTGEIATIWLKHTQNHPEYITEDETGVEIPYPAEEEGAEIIILSNSTVKEESSEDNDTTEDKDPVDLYPDDDEHHTYYLLGRVRKDDERYTPIQESFGMPRMIIYQYFKLNELYELY